MRSTPLIVAGGNLTPGSLRTVRDSLLSYGSHTSILGGWEEMSVGEEFRLVLRNGLQPRPPALRIGSNDALIWL